MYTYTQNQYIAGALHSGAIEPQVVIDRLENKHRAPLIELGINPSYILAEAKRARNRTWTRDFLLLIPTYMLISASFNIISEYKDFAAIGYGFEEIFPALEFGKIYFALLVASAIIFIHRFVTDRYLMKLATEKTPLPPDTKAHNVVISGGYSPFTGYGFDLDSWSFTVDTTKPFPGKSINWTDSCPSELLDFVSNAVASNIASATIEDKVFVSGVDIRENRFILDTPKAMPRINIPDEVIKVRVGQVDQYMRHFRVIVIPIWVGHMHLSIFLRFAVSGTNLFAEARYFLLTPLQSSLMELDKASTYCGMHYYRELLVVSAIKSTVAWIKGPVLLFHWLSNAQEHIAKAIFGDPENKLKVRSATYNYGHSASLRESWATSHYHRYFQARDKEMTYKISQHIVVNSIIDFLESKGVATDDIKERRTTIFNSGVIVSGGTINSNQMAVGSGSGIISKVTNTFSPKKHG